MITWEVIKLAWWSTADVAVYVWAIYSLVRYLVGGFK